LFLINIAAAFIVSKNTSRTIIPAAAIKWNSSCGLDIQLNIWIGIAVKGSFSDIGVNAINVKAPIIIRGAVSPIALEIARIFPVRIPGRA
jgi:hypothetical protein